MDDVVAEIAAEFATERPHPAALAPLPPRPSGGADLPTGGEASERGRPPRQAGRGHPPPALRDLPAKRGGDILPALRADLPAQRGGDILLALRADLPAKRGGDKGAALLSLTREHRARPPLLSLHGHRRPGVDEAGPDPELDRAHDRRGP